MRKKPKRTPEDRAADRQLRRQLEQRIAYHEAKLAKARAARGGADAA
jgi:hypothetical protein